jgi:hypothetical protein
LWPLELAIEKQLVGLSVNHICDLQTQQQFQLGEEEGQIVLEPHISNLPETLLNVPLRRKMGVLLKHTLSAEPPSISTRSGLNGAKLECSILRRHISFPFLLISCKVPFLI